ncbi:MAG: MBL fold metallo-hydrolase [Betaproteobacteria bacterium]|nr:MBL fold metallo-hydrolase [Betaproteobacteria bacterium]
MLTELKAGKVTIRGVSVGGVYTALHVPEYDIALDAGIALRSVAGVGTLLLTHGHVDHAGALSTLLGIRALHGHPAPLRVVMPAEIVDHVVAALDAMSALQHWPLVIEPVGLRAGDEFELRPDLLVRAHQAFHVVPCLAYQLIRRVRKLRPEFRGLPGPEIARRRESGDHDMFTTLDHLEFAYATDTLVSVLDHSPSLLESKVLLLESTFLDARKTLAAARAGCHVHLDELIERADRFRNGDLVLMHLSQIYSPSEVDGILDARLPRELRDRTRAFRPVDNGAWPG